MEKNASNNISYFLKIDSQYKNDLGNIRHWSNLKAASDEDAIWIKDFDYAQINSIEVKSIPYKTIYYEKDGKLFLQNSQLPDRIVPTLLWTAIDRILQVKLPSYNHNYFGLTEKVDIKIIPSEKEEETVAMITSVESLRRYISKAAEIRFKNIEWTILNGNKVLLVGQPLLPINGEAFWKRKDVFLPSGYDFEFNLLTDSLVELLVPEENAFIFWDTDNTYAIIHKEDLQPLSLSSFRLSSSQFNYQ